jgi:thioredoxin 1
MVAFVSLQAQAVDASKLVSSLETSQHYKKGSGMEKSFLGIAFAVFVISNLSGAVIEIKTVDDYNNLVTRSATPVVIDFFATWCPPCKRMSPIFDKLSKEFDGAVRFVKINTDSSALSSIVSQFNIRSIPTFIFKKGQTSSRRTGTMPESELRSIIQDLLAD